MNALKPALLAASLLLLCQPAPAKQLSGPAAPTPLTSPGTWVGPGDYPSAAARLDMTGNTSFRLLVDAAGKPTECNVTQSSGFDVLDEATCRAIMAKAEFSPALDAEGRQVEGVFKSSVEWRLPPETGLPASESYFATVISIDQSGKSTACRLINFSLPSGKSTSEGDCGPALASQPPGLGFVLRGDASGPSVDVEIRQALVFTPDLLTRVLASVPGYKQVGLHIHRFTVSKNGKLGECTYKEQRGDPALISDYCGEARRRNRDFDPPFGAIDEAGVAQGWQITRFLVPVSETEGSAPPPTPRSPSP